MQSAIQVDVVALQLPQALWYRITKRILDISLALFLLLCFLPLFAVCALAVWRSSPGPILFRQQRVGLRGNLFTFLKFRSMRVDSDPAIHQQYVASFIKGNASKQGRSEEPMYKLVDDPRVTSSGRWLRSTSLDELPQLLNVLRGDMSLIGPRPPIPYELEHYRPEHYQRLAVRPGITGLWQVSGRSLTTFEEMVELDLEYIRRSSLITDLSILVRTLPVVISQRGAH